MTFSSKQITELKRAQKNPKLSHYHRRIQAVYFRSQDIPYAEISKLLNVSGDTIWRLVKKYKEHGLSALTQETRGGRHRSYMTVEEEQAFLEGQMKRSSNGDFVTVQEMFEAYQKRVGRKTSREGFYALLKRHGWRKVTPRPAHPKKADAQTIVASKNKIFIQGENV